MTHSELEKYILNLKNTFLDFPFGEEVSVYKIKKHGQEKMFALIAEKSNPVRISLKCDPKLAEVLKEKYESVIPGYHLNKKHWITIICSGQLDKQEIEDLIVHSYNLVFNSTN